jgi:hypothetical protein
MGIAAERVVPSLQNRTGRLTGLLESGVVCSSVHGSYEFGHPMPRGTEWATIDGADAAGPRWERHVGRAQQRSVHQMIEEHTDTGEGARDET